MNRQEIFETVSRHLFAQGRRSSDKDGGCLYRGPYGTSCAVGCLIPDENYTDRMEFQAVDSLIINQKDRGYTLPSDIIEHQHLLRELQCIHDAENSWDNENCLRAELIRLAITTKLDSNFLDTLKFPESQ